MAKKNYYHRDKGFMKVGARRVSLLIIAILLLFGGGYLLILTQSPNLVVEASQDEMYETEQAYQQDQTDYIKIERLNLLVPIYASDNASVLEKGAWHRFPERGDPVKGGNFIVSAHRFQLGLTPQRTKAKSPFYHLDKLEEGDIIKVYYNGEWHEYAVTKLYDVQPNATEIEAPSDEAKLTLYSCSLGGEADGRIVVEAQPIKSQVRSLLDINN